MPRNILLLQADRLANLRVIVGKGELADNLGDLQAKVFQGALCKDLDGPFGEYCWQ